MKFSEYAPSLVYINTPEAIHNPTTRANKELQDALMTALQEIGLISISYSHLISAIKVALAATNQAMPYSEFDVSKASRPQRIMVNSSRDKFVQQILQSIDIDFVDNVTRYVFKGQDITRKVTDGVSDQAIGHRQTWINGINALFPHFLKRQKKRQPVAVLTTDPRRLIDDKLNPFVGLLAPDTDNPASTAAQELRMRKKTDAAIILSTEIAAMKVELTKVIHDFTELRHRAADLQSDLRKGRIKLEEQFTRDRWPGYVLMANVKRVVRPIVSEVIEKSGLLCDSLDLEYQTLFRLTSLPISSVFENGEELDAYLVNHNAYGSWKNILTLDPQKVMFPVNVSVVREIAEEQLVIIRERMGKTTLPLDKLIQRQGIFAESGWSLQKYGGRIAAIKTYPGGRQDKVVTSKTVTFGPVDLDYAKELHSMMHYIHTPRAVKAFGLYLEDDPLPFSVVAFDTIDRPYKKDLLLMHGYNPSMCLDLARLYSRPGTPFNTSSTIFTLAFAYFKEKEPEIQAVLSAFMPTYAHGMSMISAGFNYGVLVKEWRHSFAERKIDGQTAWELVTKRRINSTQTIIDSQWPLLPVFELMATLQPPRFTPFSELGGMMVSKDL